MISLAGRDIAHSWGKFALTGLGLGLLIGVTLTMAGVYRGMVDDAMALLNNSGADLWVVQKDTQGPYAEASSIRDDYVRGVLGMPGVARAAGGTPRHACSLVWCARRVGCCPRFRRRRFHQGCSRRHLSQEYRQRS